ncbi:MAG: phosphatidate cytidylyltransferase [Paracoccaceae bacterium]
MSNFIIRLISSVVLIALIFLAFSISEFTILLFCGLTVFLLFLEINKSTLISKNKVFILFSPFLGFITTFFIEQKVVFLFICLIILLFNISFSVQRFLRISAQLYILLSLYLFINIICNISGTINLKQPLYLLSLIIASDVGGYLIGKSIGQYKIFPKTSPNKTYEGALGGIFASILVWGLFFQGFTESLIIEIITVVFISLCAQFGDFLVSFVKRSLAIKDSSNFIPGHGGVFDRMDSIIGGIFGYSLIVYLGYGL